ncbi:hypothetical protein COV05_04205 [Candidatus Uhrbacteria bacterium CG10_big_fil_rev_8_21_14_0_10_48_16]|uniref:Uncharacterized protein n=1 Tax=Candidatus Uhrbacteria bacterium CG10_big_fil_rev_8_21_14_0_10_48_16 TaxID=1975038 RepID=A0A2M8LGH2_9BACT|nr:MAG: hypothetical protein COV05_04205 [Candidatus Uhrbacteria bacterium CG10_big_fil_rev_8_21_14_0_10_48_16]
MTKPSNVLIFKTAVLESMKELGRLPLWWYTTGLKQTFGKLLHSVAESVRYFGVDVWSKNLFVPMYGDASITGRLISFIVRFFVLLARSLGVLLWTVVAGILAVVYVFLLPVSVIGFVSHLIGVL